MSRILCVGVAALDIINHVPHYPAEDEELRASAQRVARGGNAANTACVLSQLGHRVDFVGTLADDDNARLIRSDLEEHDVDTRLCPVIDESRSPVSYITVNEQNGSRTIVHYRDLPELSFEQFSRLDPTGYDWFHFEGRNVAELVPMLDYVHTRRTDQPVSIEIEKERDGIELVFALADILIFSRAFVQGRGHDNPKDLFEQLRGQLPQTWFIAPWGADGAYAEQPGSPLVNAAAPTPEKLVDSIGAGDTFNAGLINALCSGQPLSAALTAAVQLAADKIGQYGFAGLAGRPGE